MEKQVAPGKKNSVLCVLFCFLSERSLLGGAEKTGEGGGGKKQLAEETKRGEGVGAVEGALSVAPPLRPGSM